MGRGAVERRLEWLSQQQQQQNEPFNLKSLEVSTPRNQETISKEQPRLTNVQRIIFYRTNSCYSNC